MAQPQPDESHLTNHSGPRFSPLLDSRGTRTDMGCSYCNTSPCDCSQAAHTTSYTHNATSMNAPTHDDTLPSTGTIHLKVAVAVHVPLLLCIIARVPSS